MERDDEGSGAPTEAPVGGGRTSRGPHIDPGGESEPGGLVPPYDDRKQSADISQGSGGDGVDKRDGAEVAGAVQPTESDQMKAPDPESTPGGRTGSPAGDEQPATEDSGGEPVDEGSVGPAHIPGVPRGEDSGA